MLNTNNKMTEELQLDILFTILQPISLCIIIIQPVVGTVLTLMLTSENPVEIDSDPVAGFQVSYTVLIASGVVTFVAKTWSVAKDRYIQDQSPVFVKKLADLIGFAMVLVFMNKLVNVLFYDLPWMTVTDQRTLWLYSWPLAILNLLLMPALIDITLAIFRFIFIKPFQKVFGSKTNEKQPSSEIGETVDKIIGKYCKDKR